MNFKIVDDIKVELPKYLSEGNEGIFLYSPKSTVVFCGLGAHVNENYCSRHNIPVIQSLNGGGAIVSFCGDLDIAVLSKDSTVYPRGDMFHSLLEYLSRFVPDIQVNKNDITIGGVYKILGLARIRVSNELTYTVIHININSDLEAIKNICKKPMVKIPKGLSEYGITAQGIIEYISSL